MKEQNFLDELFDKARNEKNRFDPDEVLKAATDPKPSFKMPFKQLWIAAAASLLIILGIVGFENLKQSRQNNPESVVITDSVSNTLAVNEHNDSASQVNSSDFDASMDNSQAIPLDEDSIHRIPSVNSQHEVPLNNSKQISTATTKVEVLSGEPEKLRLLQQVPVQHFEILANRDTMIMTEDGLRLYFEGQGIINKQNQVVQGLVQVDVKNCFGLNQYVREDLSTFSNGNLLETAGMFRIELTQGKDTLQIRQGYDYGVGLNREIPERMQLYYGNADIKNGINWKLDPVGKTPAPIVVVTGGKYEKVTDPFFYKNYRFKKSDMLQLLDSSWLAHFTSDNRQIIGRRSCNGETDAYLSACLTFNEQLAPELAKMEMFNINSRMTEFTFTCYSKDKYAYAITKGAIDSVKSYVPPSDFNYLSMPMLFPITTGWINVDCVPRLEVKWRKLNRVEKTDVKVVLPEALKVKAYLYIPETNSIARLMNTDSRVLIFKNIPAGYDVRLIITSFDKEQFIVYSGDFNVNGQALEVDAFTRLNGLDEYLDWLKKVCAEVDAAKSL